MLSPGCHGDAGGFFYLCEGKTDGRSEAAQTLVDPRLKKPLLVVAVAMTTVEKNATHEDETLSYLVTHTHTLSPACVCVLHVENTRVCFG